MQQPFKRITIEMKSATNGGVELPTTGKPGASTGFERLKDDKKYGVVVFNTTGDAGSRYLGDIPDAAPTVTSVAPIGVLMESFDKPRVGSQVQTNGIVDVVSDGTGTIAPGDFVTVSTKGTVKKATAGNLVLGMAMNSVATSNNGPVQVLLTIGGMA